MRKSLDHYTKHDWLLANTHGAIDQDTTIFRVFRVDFLETDLTKKALTLVNPCYETQKDDLENPLKSASFSVDGVKHQLFLSMMSEYYSQSWSLAMPKWGLFGEGHDTVRVQSTVGKVFSRLMDPEDPFYSLVYHVGLIEYEDANRIQHQVGTSDYDDFLDSQGYALLKTVMRIRSGFAKEQEVRFVYIRSPRSNHPYPKRHMVFGDQSQFCTHAFDWRGVIESHELNPANLRTHPGLDAAIDAWGA